MSYHWYYYLNGELIKKLKPCLAGDYVHLHSRNGCFKVIYACAYYFIIIKDRKEIRIKWEDFRCKKGEGISVEKYTKLLVKLIEYHRNEELSYIKMLAEIKS